MEKRNSRSLGRRSSILKVDNINREDDTCTGILFKGRSKPSRRVSFAETYQVKEFPRDSPNAWRRNDSDDDEDDTGKRGDSGAGGDQVTITGLDTLLTGTIQTQFYENITECPIPEMSSDSLNTSKLFDINRTILGPLDMDTTSVVESADIEEPFLDTEQDYSTEINASAILKKLKAKPSDSLTTMQIFSPSHKYSYMKENITENSLSELRKDRSPLKSLSVGQESTDSRPFHLFDDIEPEWKIDAKSFLKSFGCKQKSTLISNYDEEISNAENDNSYEDSMDETTCYGGIESKDAVKDLTNQITAKMEGQIGEKMKTHSNERLPFKDITSLNEKENENDAKHLTQTVQQSDVTANQTFAMEGTKCHGGILNKSKSTKRSIDPPLEENYTPSSENQTMVMEETKCIGGLRDKSMTKEIAYKRLSDETTKVFHAYDMDETKCIGGLRDKSMTKEIAFKRLSDETTKVFHAYDMDETKCIGGLRDKSMTKEIAYKRLSDETTKVFHAYDMDETKCEGGILNKTNFTKEFGQINLSSPCQIDDMEESKCLTGLINESLKRKPVFPVENETYQTYIMDERKSEDVILNNTIIGKQSIEHSPVKSRQDIEMEETKCLTGLINKNATTEAYTDVTKLYRNSDMEETTCQPGSIVNQSPAKDLLSEIQSDKKNGRQASPTNKSYTMESLSVPDKINSSSFVKPAENVLISEITVSDNIPLEQTNCHDVTVNKSVAASDRNDCKKPELPFLNTGSHPASQTMAMEETKCIGDIMNKSMTKAVNEKSELNATKLYQNLDMDETKCQGGILNKGKLTNEMKIANQTPEIGDTECLKVEIERNNGKELTGEAQANEDSGEIVFKSRGESNVSKTAQEDISNKLIRNQSVLMEETKCVDGFLNRSSSKGISQNTGNICTLGSSVETSVSHTILMEETKCLGGLKDNETRIYPNTKLERTMNQTLAMEMTKCITKLIDGGDDVIVNTYKGSAIETGDKEVDIIDTAESVHTTVIERQEQSSQKMEYDNGYNKLSEPDMNKSVNEMLTVSNTSCKNERLKLEEERMDEDKEDSEVMLKVSSKETGFNYADEIMRETTQSITRLQKLKDMLLLSKAKTPTHFKRPAEPKMGANQGFKDGLNLFHEKTSSPVHKKKKLFDSASFDIPKATENLQSSTDTDGIDICDEQMPDLMKMDEIMSMTACSLISEDSHLPSDVSVKANLSSTAFKRDDIKDTDQEKPDLESSQVSSTAAAFTSNDSVCTSEQNPDPKKDRLLSRTSTLSSDDSNSTGNKEISLYQKQSFMSFTSDSCLSFMIPGGHVTLDMFKKALMIKPPILVKSHGRRSSFMSPKVDTDDLGEVLQAELTLDPEVKATMAAYTDIKERTKSNEETALQLRTDIEETQPQIFQDCVDLEGPEHKALRSRVLDLLSSCHKLGKLDWANRTKEAALEALKVVQEKGLSTVSSILDDIRCDKRQTERMIQSVEDDLEDFIKTTQQLEELEKKRNTLEGELEKVMKEVEEHEQIRNSLEGGIDKEDKDNNIVQTIEDIKQNIRTHLFIQEWDLDSVDDHCAVFTFLEKELDLRILFSKSGEKTCLQSINIQSHLNPGCSKVSKRLAHSLALAGINIDMLQKKYSSFENLPQMLFEVSGTVSEIRDFCADFHLLHLTHNIQIDHRRIICDFWSVETLDEITLQLDFNPSAPISVPASIDVRVTMGTIRPEKVIEDLQAVKPGKKYLSRLFSAIKFQ